ncbi:Ceramide synthase 5 [Lonchura striata]|uniref:Ceramide synthase 5 n=1 Tax=Lonchura striata TaxID=40157 RepID=A0A218URC1_9PASE|nr:Ceramide synthase 5 [Lonchura striata domestica]
MADTNLLTPVDVDIWCHFGSYFKNNLAELFPSKSPGSTLGQGIGGEHKQRPKVQTSATLEGFYILLGRTPKKEVLVALAKQSDLPVRKVETWFRHQRAQDHPRLMKKFCEAG